MVFAKHLRAVGDAFRNKYLQSSDGSDRTHYKEDWTQMKAKMGTALGGPYLGVHLRRKDFIWGHREDVPSLQGAVKKIRSLLKMLKPDKVFVATDAVAEEIELLKKLLPEMVRFETSWEEVELYKDGDVSVIDQRICMHGRYQSQLMFNEAQCDYGRSRLGYTERNSKCYPRHSCEWFEGSVDDRFSSQCEN